MTQRRYLVTEVASSPAWSGSIWAVGCTTRENAFRAFDRHLVNNMLNESEYGTVVVLDRATRKLLRWTADVHTPKLFVKWWFPVRRP